MPPLKANFIFFVFSIQKQYFYCATRRRALKCRAQLINGYPPWVLSRGARAVLRLRVRLRLGAARLQERSRSSPVARTGSGLSLDGPGFSSDSSGRCSPVARTCSGLSSDGPGFSSERPGLSPDGWGQPVPNSACANLSQPEKDQLKSGTSASVLI
jgi:hypothetical protein